MPLNESMLKELKAEASMTRKMLERVPFDHPEWKPHEKSMTIQRLASHIAELPVWMMRILDLDEMDFAHYNIERFFAADKEALLAKFESMYAASAESLSKATDEQLMSEWTLRRGENVIAVLKKIVAVRKYVFSHVIHHRGQLSVYLRLKDIPVPGMYGPSADEK